MERHPIEVREMIRFARHSSLANRGVLVTGSASGIGASIAAHFVAAANVDRAVGEALHRRSSRATRTIRVAYNSQGTVVRGHAGERPHRTTFV
jgi:NAD(P)-dependent dehydrogenase (short-subunit alcohol dehydrogenase family)